MERSGAIARRLLMCEHLVDGLPADPRLAGDLLLRRPFLTDTAPDVAPLRDLSIHEVLPPQIPFLDLQLIVRTSRRTQSAFLCADPLITDESRVDHRPKVR